MVNNLVLVNLFINQIINMFNVSVKTIVCVLTVALTDFNIKCLQVVISRTERTAYHFMPSADCEPEICSNCDTNFNTVCTLFGNKSHGETNFATVKGQLIQNADTKVA